ncbi:hypothetical protein GCM10011247_06050 [Pseudomonas plecoglossicida]|nr:outer membrane porin [Pseudomonas plecoglossicida NB2011]GLR35208.1 hypothetical protein GCM10011247_06050 [Pseudomonas plecoglossicida]
MQYGAHTLALSHQRNNGDDDFDYLRQSDSIFLDNSIQYSDFNSPNERSWMLRYDLNMTHYGIPGLSFMTRYARGSDADYSNANQVYMRTDDKGEFALLHYLMRHAGVVLSRTQIISQVWDMNFDCDTNVVEVSIRRLRAKIDDPFDSRLIHTLRGVGYVLEKR